MKAIALALVASVVAAIVGFNLGLHRAKTSCQRERTDLSVASSAAWGNLTRIWLSEIETGQMQKVQQQMLDHIKTECMSLAAYMTIPEVQERNHQAHGTLKTLDQFVNRHETEEPQQRRP